MTTKSGTTKVKTHSRTVKGKGNTSVKTHSRKIAIGTGVKAYTPTGTFMGKYAGMKGKKHLIKHSTGDTSTHDKVHLRSHKKTAKDTAGFYY